MAARARTKQEKLFSAAVVRLSFELQDGQYKEGFRFVYEGVLRDLDLVEKDVEEYLASHRAEVLGAIGRKKR